MSTVYVNEKAVDIFSSAIREKEINITVSPCQLTPVDDSITSTTSGQTPSCATFTSAHESMPETHRALVISQWDKFLASCKGEKTILIDGASLDIPHLVAISRYGTSISIDSDSVASQIHESVHFLQTELSAGKSLYGITTGFGGSADTRTNSVKTLQVGLLQMQLSGVLPTSDIARVYPFDRALSNGNPVGTLSMPEAWVRSAMLVRCNSLVRGHSAVRLSVIEKLATLLNHNYIPFVPLRGSISASGDLSPLSYIAGTLQGNPDVQVWVDGKERGSRILISAEEAMARLRFAPVVFEAKEGLGVLNGTAVSSGVASLALHEAHHLAILSQVLTAMCVEALAGEASSFDPFIAQVRPHSGQIEVAHNIAFFLTGSRLVRKDEYHEDGHLRQDRYAIRTSSQWIGPQLEDLLLAHKQVATELNSTTDNPLINASTRKVHHGGNFQATAVTSSTEKTRLSLQMIGKMIFAQSSELLDVHQNNGLPPNLAADEPSLSYTLKGVDINMAAYMSELAFLANPVSSHVQSAEMNNQAINSLALVSARYTHTAVDVLSLMCSAHLYSLCQALDLRAMQAAFLDCLKPAIEQITKSIFGTIMSKERMDQMNTTLWPAMLTSLSSTRCKDSSDRFIIVAKSVQSLLLEIIFNTSDSRVTMFGPLGLIHTWSENAARTAEELFVSTREDYMARGDASQYLGTASKEMYNFVRKELNVPFHRGLCDHPDPKFVGFDLRTGCRLKTTGSQISVIHEALRSGRLMVPVIKCLKDSKRQHNFQASKPTSVLKASCPF